MNDNNLFSLSLKLYRANRKKSLFMKIIIFVIFIFVLFFINTLFSSFEKTINETDFALPMFIVTKEGGSINLQKNNPLRKSCLLKDVLDNMATTLLQDFNVKEGFIFETYFTEIGSNKRNNVLVELVDFSSISKECLRKIDVNTNKGRAIPIYVNKAFCNNFDLKSDYLVYLNDFFGDLTITRMRAESSLLVGNSLRSRCYIDLETLKPYLSVPEDLSLPIYLYYKGNISIFSPKYLNIKHKLLNQYKDSEFTIKPYYSIDTNATNIFSFYLHILIIIVTSVILILIYAMSVSYYINFNTRKRDFALFRAFGLTNTKLFWLMFLENFYTCFSAFVVSFLINLLIGIFVKGFSVGSYSFGFNMSWPGIITLVIILVATSFISIIKAYRHIIKGTNISTQLERK